MKSGQQHHQKTQATVTMIPPLITILITPSSVMIVGLESALMRQAPSFAMLNTFVIRGHLGPMMLR